MKLFTKMLVWFFVSLAVVGAVALAFTVIERRADPESPLRGRTGARTRATVRLIGQELRATDRGQWDAVLARWSEAYDVTFLLVSRKGRLIAGDRVDVPGEVVERLAEERGFLLRTVLPVRYWLALPMPVPRADGRFSRTVLLMVSSTRSGSLIGDAAPWAAIGAAVLLLSALLWLPLARSVTRPIAEITRATERVARGHFDVRLPATRRDEIGRLAAAINDMAARLDRMVAGQRRFLADVSHELRSPLARMKIALDLLDAPDPATRERYAADLAEDVEHMAALVDELMAVARTEHQSGSPVLSAVSLSPLVARIARREAREGVTVEVDAPEDIVVSADENLLGRALGNVLRNAVRYAGTAGPIRVEVRRLGREVVVEVSDEGPGVPAEDVPRIFDPFYRPARDRDRDSGGAGLGLAIVKTCVEACGGRVEAANRSPRGFLVRVALEARSGHSYSPATQSP